MQNAMRFIGKSKAAFCMLLAAAVFACSDDEKDTDPQPEDNTDNNPPAVVVPPVTHLKAERTYLAGELQLSWSRPAEAVLTEISYWKKDEPEANAEKRTLSENSLLITVDEPGTYTIAATAIDNYGRRSEQATIEATPREEDAPTRFVQKNDRLLIADPYCFYHDGKYYAYGTQYATGFPVYTSTDLVHWAESRAMQNTDSWGSEGNTWWAAEVYPYNNRFYMFYVINEHVCIATADSPKGPFKQSIKSPLTSNEKNIDPHLFVDDDGTPYLYYVRFTGGNVIWVAEMEKNLSSIKTSTLTECVKATDEWEKKQGSIVEGPSIIKHNGLYYLIYSANHYQCKDYAVGYATSESPLGPWKKFEGNPILRRDMPAAGGLAGVGHGAPFQCADGSWKYIFHAHEFAGDGEGVGKRSSYIQDLYFTEDGEIRIDGTLIRPVSGIEEYIDEEQ